MITILYPYRNRENNRVKRSLDSLVQQMNRDFRVVFIDYGSNSEVVKEIEELVTSYTFAQYCYCYNLNQPWSRSKAINIGLKLIETPYIFVADIDMIFKENFIEKLLKVANPNQAIYFKVGFLSKEVTSFSENFDTIPIAFTSDVGAQGLSLFAIESLYKVNGFDEFYHFWGAEDADIHVRLQNAGYEVVFYDSEILMLHQWHPSYRSTEQKVLTKDIQLSGVVQLNHQHLKEAIAQKKTKVNDENWGTSISEQEYQLLQNPIQQIEILNRKPEIEHFLYFTLKQKTTVPTKYVFQLDPEQNSFKQKIKRVLGKRTPQYYSLKEVNDFILRHLISTPAIKNYRYQVAPDLKSISLSI